jgi:Dolichyl-phosphate-mannose-protein mannosyltransferase
MADQPEAIETSSAQFKRVRPSSGGWSDETEARAPERSTAPARNGVAPGSRMSSEARRPHPGVSAGGGWDLWTRGSLAFILLLTSILMLRGINNPNLHYPDADRIRMDGVFVLDFLKALPLTRIYQFTVQYYAQYPAINIGYHPPFFALIEALFNAVGGISVWSSRLALLPFMLVGLTAWFALVRRVFDTTTAFWTTLLFATTPFVVQWGWYTMSDLPLLFLTMLLGYLFFRSTESPKPVYLYASALVLVSAIWTKQTAIFVILWFSLYLVLRRKLFSYLASWHLWLSLLLVGIALIPIALMTAWLGDFNLAQSIGSNSRADLLERLDWDNLVLYPWFLWKDQVTGPFLAVSAIGLGLALRKRDARPLYFGVLIATTYAFFTYVLAKEARYTMAWIPAFAVFAALPLWYLKQVPAWRRAYMLVLAGIVAYQVVEIYRIEPSYATGSIEAARYVVDHHAANMVFFDGSNNGNFTYYIRALDRDRSISVLRGDKLLSSSALEKRMRLEVHAHSRQDIADILDKYGVADVVVEGTETSNVEIHHELRRFLDSGPFQLVKTIPIDSNIPGLQGNTLKVYRYLAAKPQTADRLELRVPLVGATINVPLRRATHP